MLPPEARARGRSDGIGVTGPPRRRSSLRVLRWIPLALALGALGAFGGIVVYAYYLVDRGAADAGVPLIRAETAPIKVRPDSPGGMQVPHQDKEIYARINPRWHGRLLAAPRLLVCMDADEAGQAATAEIASSLGVVRVLSVPEQKDFNDYARTVGSAMATEWLLCEVLSPSL